MSRRAMSWEGVNSITTYGIEPTPPMEITYSQKALNAMENMKWDAIKRNLYGATPIIHTEYTPPSRNQFYDEYNNNFKETTKMATSDDAIYYQTLTDLPTIEVGAILVKHCGRDHYVLYNNLWAKDNVPSEAAVYVQDWNVENSPEFYKRVYKLRDDSFGTKEQALSELNSSIIAVNQATNI